MTDNRISLHQVKILPPALELEPWAMYYVKAANSNYVSQYITWKTDQGVEITPIGKSAYQHWLDEGNVGDVSDFINFLKGEKGPVGPDGSAYTYSGVGIPDNADGVDGNTYLDLSSNFVYKKVSGDWGAPVGELTYQYADVLTKYAVNLYQDSGRMAGNNAYSVTIGAFSFPQYLTIYNGSVATAHGKFTHNNSTYGGSGGALTTEVNELMTKIKDGGYRRWGVEFWVANIVQGGGVGSGAFTHDGITGRLSLYTGGIKAPNSTFHAYFKAVTAPILIKKHDGLDIYVDGVKQVDSISILPSHGWLSVAIADSVIPRKTVSYQPATVSIYAESGTEYLMACPALIGGITKVDPDSGVIASGTSWPA